MQKGEQQPIQITRRDLFKMLGAVGVGMMLPPLSNPGVARSDESPVSPSSPINKDLPPIARPIELDSTERARLTEELMGVAQSIGVDNIGYPISIAWRATDGDYLATQGAIIQKQGNNIALWNISDEMHKAELDEKLEDGSLGVNIPPHEDYDDGSNGDFSIAFARRVEHFGIPEDVLGFVNGIREVIEVGTPTSFGKNYPDDVEIDGLLQHVPDASTVYRFQRLAVEKINAGRDSGMIRTVLLGEASARLGIIPETALLPEPYIYPKPEVDEILGVKTQIVDSVITKKNGKTYIIESRVAPDAKYKVLIIDDKNDELGEYVAENGEIYGFNKAEIVVLGQHEAEGPDGDTLLQLSDGTYINPTFYYDLFVGQIGSGRVNNTIVFYFKPGRDIQNPKAVEGADAMIQGLFTRAIAANGDSDSQLNGDQARRLDMSRSWEDGSLLLAQRN